MQNVINWIGNLSYWQAALVLFASWVIVIFIPGIAKVDFVEMETSSYAERCNMLFKMLFEVGLCYVAYYYFYYIAYLMLLLQTHKAFFFSKKLIQCVLLCLQYRPSYWSPPFKHIFVFLLQAIFTLVILAALVVFCYLKVYRYIWPFA